MKKLLAVLLILALSISVIHAQAQASGGVAVIGDSLSHEYRCVPRGSSTAFNWVEILAQKRGVNFGALSGNCYEFDHAWSGNTITYQMSQMVTWALEDFDLGADRVVILLGYNDVSQGTNIATLINTYGTQVDRLKTRYAAQNILAVAIPQEDCGSNNANVTNFNNQLASLAVSKGIQFSPWTDYCLLLGTYSSGTNYNFGGQTIQRYTWCNTTCLRIPDGHPGTISQSVIANALIADFLGVTPVTEAEVLAMMGIGSAPTATPSRTPTVTRTPTITNTPLPTATPTPIILTCPLGMHWESLVPPEPRSVKCVID